jgi:signal transduction histidine kinase
VAPHPFGGLIEIFEDVTDTVGLERKYNEQIAVQRRTLDNLYEGVAVWGSDGRLRLFNSAYAQIWGLDPLTLEEGPHVAEVLEAQRQLLDDGGEWERVKSETINEITGGNPRSGRHTRVDGTVIDYAYVPLPDGALLATYIDVTDSQRKEEVLRERNAALEAADQLKSEFITNVSYQLRTPLTTIIGFAEMLKYGFFGALNERQQGYIANILDSANQLLELIDNILDLAMIEAGQMALEREPFELTPMLGAMVQLVGDSARKRNQRVTLDAGNGIGWLDANQRRVKQVLFNLLTNAIKYTPPGGTVTLGAKRAGEEIELSVTDTGVGIAPEERAQMFGKFTTGSRTSRTAGAGLGLALVKNFIELHGGTVTLDTPQDGGTRVTCKLPASTAT